MKVSVMCYLGSAEGRDAVHVLTYLYRSHIYVFCLKVTVYNSIQKACIIGMALLSHNLPYEQR